jgi:hypothetical protein
MAKQTSRNALERDLRLSRRALRFGVGFALAALGVVWGLHAWLRFPSWIGWGLSFFAVFGPIGDAINIVHCRQKLRHVEG